MTDEQQHGAASEDISLAAVVLDHVLQARDEGQVTLETAKDIYGALRALALTVGALTARLDTHIAAVEERHRLMLEQAQTLLEQDQALLDKVERNTRSREDAEWEITNLHSVLKDWHRYMVDNHAALVHVLEVLRLKPDLRTLRDMPGAPKRRERAVGGSQ